MRPPAPPRFALRILRACAAPGDRRFVEEDLREEFDAIAARDGFPAARRWYVRQTLASAFPLLASRVRPPRVTQFARHVRHSARVLRRAPGATLAAVATLALGIGANTAVFSVVDAVLLRPLPYERPDRLVSVWQTRNGERTTLGFADFADYSSQSQTLEALGAFSRTTRALGAGDAPEELPGDIVSVTLFPLLGVQPAHGRRFSPEDAREGATPTVILSDAVWRSRFGADPSIIGRPVPLNAESHVVIGVMPRGFQAPSQLNSPVVPSFFLPAPEASSLMPRNDRTLLAIGRLRPGATVAHAADELKRIDAAVADRYPDAERGIRSGVARLDQDVTRRVRVSLYVILGCVALVVLIASVNVANLLIVQALGQRHEVAIRLALGARRADIVAEYAARGVLLSALGAVGGIAVAFWTRNLLLAAAPASMPYFNDLTISLRVLAATAFVTIASGVTAGVIPALQVLRGSARGSVQVTEQMSSGSRALRRWQGALVAAEIAAAVVIALGAGLLVRSVIHLNRIEIGFQTERVLTIRLQSLDRNVTPQARLVFFQQVSERVARIPGVESVAFANRFPLRGGWGGRLQVMSPAGPVDAEADMQAVSDSYFTTLGVPLVRGRFFSAADQRSAPAVVIVSQTFASRLLSGRDPIGAVIRRGPDAPLLTVVGVVGEIRRDGKLAAATPQLYFPAAQTHTYAAQLEALAVRSAHGNPRELVPAIRLAVAAVNPRQPLSSIYALDEILQASVSTWRFNMLLLGSFAALALVLAIVGVYGIVAHAAQQRRREIGVRSALGATRGSIVRLVVAGALAWALPGIVAGIAIARSFAQVMSSMLFNVAPTDLTTYGAVTALMLVAAAAASYVPARRAAAADPLRTLRTD